MVILSYVGALLLTRRRAALRSHRLSLGVLLAGTAAAIASAPRALRLLLRRRRPPGRDWDVPLDCERPLPARPPTASCCTGGSRRPGDPRGRRDVSFAALVTFQALALLIAAGLYASNGTERFQGRYLFSLFPLVPIVFASTFGRAARPTCRDRAGSTRSSSCPCPALGFAVSSDRRNPLLWAVVDSIRWSGPGRVRCWSPFTSGWPR